MLMHAGGEALASKLEPGLVAAKVAELGELAEQARRAQRGEK
jgi:hypothetical protein